MPWELPMNDVVVARRVPLNLTIEGLAARDELLLKSLIRLLDHRTHQQWSFTAQRFDLKVEGEGFSATHASNTDPAVPVLRIGRERQQGDHFLNLPLHADELEQMLNRIGAQIVDTRHVAPDRGAALPALNDQEFQLKRWPPAPLLAGSGHLALATLLASRPTTLAELQQRSGAARSVCVAFVSELQRAELLHVRASRAAAGHPAATPQPAMPVTAPPSLFARIRRALGLPLARAS
jgi:hypothetical protein